jgi:hypothetical protein
MSRARFANQPQGRDSMMDLIYILIVIGFFAIAAAYASFCEKI